MTKPWTIEAKADGLLDILMYEPIGQDIFSADGLTAKAFAEDLAAAGKINHIHLRINCVGGQVFDGLAIYNQLVTHPAKVTAQVDGIAASIASVILMAADEIDMAENSMLMIHNPHSFAAGDSQELRKMADTMDKVKGQMIRAYQRHTKLGEGEVSALMDAETWLTAEEAVAHGFANQVSAEEKMVAVFACDAMFGKFRKTPARIAARLVPKAEKIIEHMPDSGRSLPSILSIVVHIPDHKNSKGESAPWCVKDEDTGEIISSHKTRQEAEAAVER